MCKLIATIRNDLNRYMAKNIVTNKHTFRLEEH